MAAELVDMSNRVHERLAKLEVFKSLRRLTQEETAGPNIKIQCRSRESLELYEAIDPQDGTRYVFL